MPITPPVTSAHRKHLISRAVATLPKLGPSQVAEAYLVGALWWYSASVLYPARLLRRGGVNVVGGPVGEEPAGLPRPGLGPRFSKARPEPVLLDAPSEHGHLVEEFDELAEFYELLVRPFSTPIFDEALRVIRRYLTSDSRVLDVGCGPGRELRRVAALLPDGEAVGVDLAAGMVRVAHAAARDLALDNCAFFQADVCNLPRRFNRSFDLVYSSLAHHHYPDPAAAAAGVLRCLRPGGVYCVIDPGPAWFNTLSAPLGRLADPGWIGWKTPREFRALFESAGFARTCWIPLLPGFGIALAQASQPAALARAR
jgi:ubiquinone/menaquinone biosynthesis C-methylase UbiE